MKGRRILGVQQPNGRKDRDDDLLLFRELHKKEKTVSLLQPVSDEFEPTGNYPLYRMASAKKGPGSDFLVESEKNDYNWLKTPPATPLFPSLEMEANAPELIVQRELPIPQLLSRFTGNTNSEAPKAGNRSRPKTPNLKPKAHLLAESRNSKSTQNSYQKTTQLSTSHDLRRNGTTNHHKEGHSNFLTCNLSKSMQSSTDSKTKPISRGVSPQVRSTIPSQIPGFSDDTPPNLRTTTDRPSSATRGRPNNNPTVQVHQKPEASVKPIRRQSCSPSMTRGRKVEAKQESSEGNLSSNQRGRIQTGNGTHVFGSRMVDRVMNARKSGGDQEREAKTPNSNAGFGRIMSKTSLDMAVKHMEIKRDRSNFRSHATTTQGSKPTSSTSCSHLTSRAI